MKDHPLSALMLFFIALVALILLNDLFHPSVEEPQLDSVQSEVKVESETELSALDELQ